MLYKEPEFLFSELSKVRNTENPDPSTSMLICPAVSGLAKNILTFTVPYSCSYSYSTDQRGVFHYEPITPQYLELSQVRDPSLSIGPSITTPLQILLFAEEPLVARLSPPYFHEPKHTKYGASTFGEFDIGQWFRTLTWELQLWKKEGVISFEEGEPAFYLEFKTDKRIVLKKVRLTEELMNISLECINSTRFYGKFLPLAKRYKRFREAGMRERVLSELRANVIQTD